MAATTKLILYNDALREYARADAKWPAVPTGVAALVGRL